MDVNRYYEPLSLLDTSLHRFLDIAIAKNVSVIVTATATNTTFFYGEEIQFLDRIT